MSRGIYDKVNKELIPTAGSEIPNVDAIPTKNSTNPVQSGGTYDALEEKVSWEQQNILGAKNLNKYPYVRSSGYVDNGITFTINEDGSVIANGTAEGGNATFLCHSRLNTTQNPLVMPNGSYILSGCPSGGSTSTYLLRVNRTHNNDGEILGTDIGAGASITLNGDDYSNDEVYLGVFIIIVNGQTVSNLTFKPMIRLASDTDDTYVPYSETNRQLTEKTNAIDPMLNILGAKNLLPNNAVTQTVNGVTFTVNSDGSVTCNGTSSASIQLIVGSIDKLQGIYILTGCPLGGSVETYELRLTTAPYLTLHGRDFGYGYECNLNDSDINVIIVIRQGVTVSNLVFKPMLRPASIKDDTYVPYAMTNRELTEQITSIGAILETAGSVHPTVENAAFNICSLTLPKGVWAVTIHSETSFSGSLTYNNIMRYSDFAFTVRQSTMNGGGIELTRYINVESPTVVTAQGYSTSEFMAADSRKQVSRIQAIRIA